MKEPRSAAQGFGLFYPKVRKKQKGKRARFNVYGKKIPHATVLEFWCEPYQTIAGFVLKGFVGVKCFMI